MDHYIALDIETTGLDTKTSGIIEIAMIEVENGEIIDEFDSLINPGIPVSSFIAQHTGITNEMLADADDFDAYADEISAWLSAEVTFITFNGSKFDLPILWRHLDDGNDNLKHVDIYKLAKERIPGLESYKQDAIAAHLGVAVDVCHRAGPDVRTLMQIYEKLRTYKPSSIQQTIVKEHNPTVSDALLALAEHVEQILTWTHQAEDLPCNNEDEFETTVKAEIGLKEMARLLDKERKKHVAPIKQIAKKIDSHFKVHAADPIKKALAAINSNQQSYLLQKREADRIKQAAIESRAAGLAEEAELAAVKKGRALNDARDHANEVYEAHTDSFKPEPTKTEAGSATVISDWDVEITNAKFVPTQYLSPDLKKIKFAIAANDGELQIPGVTHTPIFKTRTRRSF